MLHKSYEVGSIIGKKGEIVKRFREESGAKINISDGSCPERIVTVSGSTSAIYKAFTLITKKFEEWCSQFNDVSTSNGKTQIPIRLIVPASQCGSLIGKGGAKIKEIREVTGCSIQVASEMLPNSTERAVTLSGSAEAITQCIYHICCVMLESPPKGATIPYRPKPVNGPVILANGQAFTIQGNYAVPTQEMSGLAKNPLAGLAALGLAGAIPTNTGGLNPTALAALAGSQLRTANNRSQAATTQSHEMTVPNDLIGCIIGKGGTKIAEIRQISGAMIRISNCEEREGGNTDRTITISGNPDSVALAQYLINMSVELQKANLAQDASATSLPSLPPTLTSSSKSTLNTSQTTCSNGTSTNAGSSPPSSTSSSLAGLPSSLAAAIPLAQLLSKPGALNALTSLSALGGLTDLLGGLATLTGPPVQTTGAHRVKPNVGTRAGVTRTSTGGNSFEHQSNNKKFTNERNKFNPY
uniref:CSON014746 protein n=1 Tax=Culicoides sonorensis TaxID=179676 RepID=A0A336MFK0_CULSO